MVKMVGVRDCREGKSMRPQWNPGNYVYEGPRRNNDDKGLGCESLKQTSEAIW